jgi:putative oxidoreductase
LHVNGSNAYLGPKIKDLPLIIAAKTPEAFGYLFCCPIPKTPTMSVLQQFRDRVDRMPSPLLFLLRVALGCMLIAKGVSFISHIGQLEDIIAASHFQSFQVFLTHFIPYAHLLGGFFILIGLYTQFFSWIQLPILFGAVFFINMPHAAFNVEAGELGFSIVVFVLLIFFSIEGSGPYSIQEYVRKHAV